MKQSIASLLACAPGPGLFAVHESRANFYRRSIGARFFIELRAAHQILHQEGVYALLDRCAPCHYRARTS
mgnify:CR=1 FL=1